MIAPYDEEHKNVYIERSPIHYVDRLSCALALFQGDEDKVCFLCCYESKHFVFLF